MGYAERDAGCVSVLTPEKHGETQMHPDAQIASLDSSTFKVHLCLAGY
jgi:hypothetical protein